MSSNQPIGAAVIGCVHIGTQHARFLGECSRARLDLVCDVSGDAADRLAAPTGAVPTIRVSKVLDHLEIDATFLPAFIDGTESPFGIRDGQRATALYMAAFQSIRTGLPVDLTRSTFAAAVGTCP